jgi:antirestriction protein ArdC
MAVPIFATMHQENDHAHATTIREAITNQIIEALQIGLPPWRKPWANWIATAGAPVNIVSKKQYRGINPLLLAISSMKHGFQSKWWATFNQWKELGGQRHATPHNVPRGSVGHKHRVLATGYQDEETDANGEEQEDTYFMLKTYTVFNIDQVEGDHLDHLRVGHSDRQRRRRGRQLRGSRR